MTSEQPKGSIVQCAISPHTCMVSNMCVIGAAANIPKPHCLQGSCRPSISSWSTACGMRMQPYGMWPAQSQGVFEMEPLQANSIVPTSLGRVPYGCGGTCDPRLDQPASSRTRSAPVCSLSAVTSVLRDRARYQTWYLRPLICGFSCP